MRRGDFIISVTQAHCFAIAGESCAAIENGQVTNTNFHEFPLLRMSQAAQIDVHFLPTNSARAKAQIAL